MYTVNPIQNSIRRCIRRIKQYLHLTIIFKDDIVKQQQPFTSMLLVHSDLINCFKFHPKREFFKYVLCMALVICQKIFWSKKIPANWYKEHMEKTCFEFQLSLFNYTTLVPSNRDCCLHQFRCQSSCCLFKRMHLVTVEVSCMGTWTA